MGHLSPAGVRVMAAAMHNNGPHQLRKELEAGEILTAELPDLILYLWTRDDSPTSNLDEAAWVQIFRQAGFFSSGAPSTYPQPIGTITLYRGATYERARRMSWSDEQDLAEELGRRHMKYGATAVYRAAVAPDAVLAALYRPAEGWTIVVDPSGLPAELEVVRRLSG